MLSTAAKTVWAKTDFDRTTNTPQWLPLFQHLADASGVAGKIWDTWVSDQVRRRIAAPLGGDVESAGRLLRFLAAVHDIGKATPVFAVQARGLHAQLTDQMHQCGLAIDRSIDASQRALLPHGLAGHVLLARWLRQRYGWSQPHADSLAVVVGGHHGIPPDDGHLLQAERRSARELLGEGTWTQVQGELLDWAAATDGIGPWLEDRRDAELGAPVQALLTGLVVTADWLASNTFLFPLVDLEQAAPDDPGRLDDGWRRVHLPAAWKAIDEGRPAAELLQRRFTFGPDKPIRPIQEGAVQAARRMDVPGILVIEAGMGEGKTEAALLAAEILASRSGAGGCFVALPTQATSDAMFGRVLQWLSHVPDAALAADAGWRAGRHTVELAHGKAFLNPVLRELKAGGRATGIGVDQPGRFVGDDRSSRQTLVDAELNWWMSDRRRGQLADFVVGTIDQLLFAGLRARHLGLRHLADARKVVIIDEAHAFDAYMNVYLHRALEWLGAYGVPVIVLSATLPDRSREQLARAYLTGVDRAGDGVACPAPAPPPGPARLPASHAASAYPAVTYAERGEIRTAGVGTSARRLTVQVEQRPDADDELLQLLGDALAEGGAALVVRNTVERARSTARLLRERLPDADILLDHSRFIASDRARIDQQLRDQFGPPDEDGHSAARPERAVVVATQVVEQSLDVDFDLLVTDLAPIDLILQRVGRLHRHLRGSGEHERPAPLRQARCVVVGTDWATTPPTPEAGSRAVYGDHLLLRAAALLGEVAGQGGRLELPRHIHPLVQRGYDDDEQLGPASWQQAMAQAAAEARRERELKETKADAFLIRHPWQGDTLVGWLDGASQDPEAVAAVRARAQVRDTEETVEALLLVLGDDGRLRFPHWLTGAAEGFAGELVTVDARPEDDEAAAIAGCAVRLPRWVGFDTYAVPLIRELEQYYYPPWQLHPALRGQLVLPLGDGSPTRYAGLLFRYDPTYGLEVERGE